MSIEVIAEADPPLPVTGAEAARQAGFGSTAALGQFTRLRADAGKVLAGLWSPLTPVESALIDLLRSADVQVPADLDARDYAHRVIAVRRGQQSFRQGLLQAFDRRCCISGSGVEATLEAAHIRPYRGTASHEPGNGLLLRADLHTLFDLHLLTVLPVGAVRISPELTGSEYEELDERQILRPVEASHSPSRAALEGHNAACPWLPSS